MCFDTPFFNCYYFLRFEPMEFKKRNDSDKSCDTKHSLNVVEIIDSVRKSRTE